MEKSQIAKCGNSKCRDMWVPVDMIKPIIDPGLPPESLSEALHVLPGHEAFDAWQLHVLQHLFYGLARLVWPEDVFSNLAEYCHNLCSNGGGCSAHSAKFIPEHATSTPSQVQWLDRFAALVFWCLAEELRYSRFYAAVLQIAKDIASWGTDPAEWTTHLRDAILREIFEVTFHYLGLPYPHEKQVTF